MLESNTKPKTSRSHIKSARGFSKGRFKDDGFWNGHGLEIFCLNVFEYSRSLLTLMWKSGVWRQSQKNLTEEIKKQPENKTKQITDSEKSLLTLHPLSHEHQITTKQTSHSSTQPQVDRDYVSVRNDCTDHMKRVITPAQYDIILIYGSSGKVFPEMTVSYPNSQRFTKKKSLSYGRNTRRSVRLQQKSDAEEQRAKRQL